VARLEESRAAFERARAESEAERQRLEAARAETEALGADLRARQRRRWSDDLDASRQFLRDLETRGRALIEELRQKPEPAALRSFVRASGEAIARRAGEMEPEAPAARPPVPGDQVEVIGRGIRGELVEITGERARIQRGGLRFEVAADQLRVVGAEPARPRVVVEVAVPPTRLPRSI
jgi:dsDNA-specific endonuclease/ATPase MutS2